MANAFELTAPVTLFYSYVHEDESLRDVYPLSDDDLRALARFLAQFSS